MSALFGLKNKPVYVSLNLKPFIINPSDQLQPINDAINKTKAQLKPTSVNFIFWGILITLMSITHLLHPEFIRRNRYSSMLFWTVIPVIGMIMSIVYNIKMGVKKGYETHLGRALKITWEVFNIAWIAIVVMSILVKKDSSDFNYLKKMTNSTRGNLSIQLKSFSIIIIYPLQKVLKKLPQNQLSYHQNWGQSLCFSL